MSRLSTTAFSGRNASAGGDRRSPRRRLRAVGRLPRRRNSHFKLDVELAETRSGRVLWVESLEDDLSAILSGEQELIGRLIAGVGAAVTTRELQRSRSAAPADAQGLHAADGRRQPDASPVAARLRGGPSPAAGADRPRRAPSAAHRLARQLARAARPAGLVRRSPSATPTSPRSAPSARSTWIPTIRWPSRSTASCTSTS